MTVIRSQVKECIAKKIKKEKKSDNTINLKQQKNSCKRRRVIRKTEDNQRAMVSEKIVYPEKKNELEKILIERIAFDPRDIDAYEKLGDYYTEQGSDKDAKECYNQVLRLNPHNLNIRKKLGRIK